MCLRDHACAAPLWTAGCLRDRSGHRPGTPPDTRHRVVLALFRTRQQMWQANRALARGSSIEHDVAREDWHRTTQEGHARQLLREWLDSPTDRVHVKCDICFGAVAVGPPLSARSTSSIVKQAADLSCSTSTYVPHPLLDWIEMNCVMLTDRRPLPLLRRVPRLDEFRYATLYGAEVAARRVFRGLDQLGKPHAICFRVLGGWMDHSQLSCLQTCVCACFALPSKTIKSYGEPA